ncbi:MAG: hypothetical protein U0704_05370 [Candidatus Eisenbacteria bacterium]
MHRVSRALAVGAAVVLLAVSGFAPRLRADRVPEPAVGWPVTLDCAAPIVQTTGGATVTIPSIGAIAQPLPFTANIAACSLAIAPVLNTAMLRVSQWDAANLMPDPTTVALRTVAMMNSYQLWVQAPILIDPPVVTRAFELVADPPGGSGAIEFLTRYSTNSFTLSYDPASTSEWPAGYSRAAGAYEVLPGAHGVFAATLCGGDPATQALRVAQCVMHTDVIEDGNTLEFLQRFRVPRAVRMRWVEFAFDTYTLQSYPSSTIGLYEAFPSPTVPTTLPAPITETSFYPFAYEPSWVTPYDFDSTVVLQPGRDYWLRVLTGKKFRLRAHNVANTPGFDPRHEIGPLMSRTTGTEEWIWEVGRALSFRIIGDASGLLDVASAPAPRTFDLRATPNPARSATTLAWSGASGRVRFEVLDARGRRVAAEDADTGPSGRWTWNLAGALAPLAPGLYFVRAHDDAGASALARVVVIR